MQIEEWTGQLKEAEERFQLQLQEAAAHFQEQLQEERAKYQRQLHEAEVRFQEQLQEERAKYQKLLQEAEAKIKELQSRLKKDSHNSSKPPSTDGLGRKPNVSRKISEKLPGGQVGHKGRTLLQVAVPDTVVSHRPESCCYCQADLRQSPGQVKERRQVHDLPELRLRVEEHLKWTPLSRQEESQF